MYQWVVVHVKKHPRYVEQAEGGCNTLQLMDELYNRLVREAKVMVMPGHLFVVAEDGVDGSKDTNHLRVCVSAWRCSSGQGCKDRKSLIDTVCRRFGEH